MINQKLQGFKEEVKPIGEILTQATLELYYAVSARFLPTPAKIHYLFNLRDISKVHVSTLRWVQSIHVYPHHTHRHTYIHYLKYCFTLEESIFEVKYFCNSSTLLRVMLLCLLISPLSRCFKVCLELIQTSMILKTASLDCGSMSALGKKENVLPFHIILHIHYTSSLMKVMSCIFSRKLSPGIYQLYIGQTMLLV